MRLSGWGRYPEIEGAELTPDTDDAVRRLFESLEQGENLIPRGAGRSYGDSALASRVISSRYLDYFLDFNPATGELCCNSGVTLSEVISACLPHGWFPAVVPGTKFVTVGGAIASDIHGKNHHVYGSFSECVQGLELLLPSGELINCSRTNNADLFHATCAGQGLTGMIISARLQLMQVPGQFLRERVCIARNLEEALQLFRDHDASTYSVAWLDCMANSDSLGRSLVFIGEHEKVEGQKAPSKLKLNVPFSTPAFFLNSFTINRFNDLYFRFKSRKAGEQLVHYDGYFFPLDSIHNWNRLYGRRGFLQYQFVVPEASALETITEVLRRLAEQGKGSFLSVLKKFGKANQNLLSFPIEGYTLTLDFKYEQSLFPLLDELDRIVVANGGRLYLAKDARMSPEVFRLSYPLWEKFSELKSEIDPAHLFLSSQASRLGL